MQVHTDLTTFTGVERPVLTTGTFDGVHLGHQTILHRLKEVAQREEEGQSVLFTFYPAPAHGAAPARQRPEAAEHPAGKGANCWKPPASTTC